ncbi:hypothetical protein [Kordiimonas sp.]|uniref:hypothetical protein n=1 Tax=Kordiimonas sp. TaxID=1970157 RepID=UPI003A8EC84E
MKLIAAAMALSLLSSPAYGFSSFSNKDAALAKIPGLVELCGQTPTAPAKVRGSSPLKPLRRTVPRFVESVEVWLACAAAIQTHIQYILNDMPSGDANRLVVAYLNTDYEQQYANLNAEVETFADRVNQSGDWQIVSPVVEDLHKRQCGGSEEAEVLCYMRSKTFASHPNKPLPVKPDGPVHWTPVTPTKFTERTEPGT